MSICDNCLLASPQNINVFVSTQATSTQDGKELKRCLLCFSLAASKPPRSKMPPWRWPGGKKSVSWRWSPQDQVAGGQVGKVEPLVIRSQPLAYAAQRRLLHYSLLVSTSATSLPPEPPLYVLVGVHHSMERFSPGATPPTILQPIRRCAQQYNCLVLYFY